MKWISIEDRLPEKLEKVLVCGTFGLSDVIPAVYEYDGTWRVYGRGARVADVTHWMPLPDPPRDKVCRCEDCRYFGDECAKYKTCYALSDCDHQVVTTASGKCDRFKRKTTETRNCNACRYWAVSNPHLGNCTSENHQRECYLHPVTTKWSSSCGWWEAISATTLSNEIQILCDLVRRSVTDEQST